MSRRNAFFITGTDTDVGKTFVASAMLHAFNALGKTTIGLKPVAAGCEETSEGLRNADALELLRSMSIKLPYEQVNPIALKSAIAPHIAAHEEGRRLTISRLVGLCRGAMMQPVDVTLIEGAGGWRVPISDRETLAELPKQLELPVVLVVGVRLGCINHALLTAEAIRRDGLQLVGWVANCIDPGMPNKAENIQTLKQALGAPCLGEIPFKRGQPPESVCGSVDVGVLL